MTSISSGSGPIPSGVGEPTSTDRSTGTGASTATGTVAARDGSGDAAALARTEAARPEAPGSGMTEGPRLELQQWNTRLGDLNRELEALPAGSTEANAKLAEIHQHLARLAAIQARVEAALRSAPSALAQDYLLLLGSSRSALNFINNHRSDPGSEAFGSEATLIGELQSRRDRSLASLRTLGSERLLPSLRVAEGADPSEQQIGDYRLLLHINGALGEAEVETLRLPRELTTTYSACTHADTIAAGGELPDYMRSSLFRDLDPHPVRTGEAPEAHSPDAEFPEGHPMRDLYRTLWEHRGESFSEADANRLIQQLQGLRGELAEGGRYGNFIFGSNRGNLTASLENLERLLRNAPRRLSEDDLRNMERPLRLLGTLEYQAQLQSSAGTTTRGRISLYWRLYEEYRRLGNGEAARGCLYNIYQTSQMNLLPENRTNGLSEADRQAVLVRFLEAYVDSGRLDVNFASMFGSLGREIRRLWEHGTEESRFTALSLWTRYNSLHRRIDADYTDGTMNFLLLESPHALLGTTEEGLPALLQDMENRARASDDPNIGAARLIMVAQAYASNGDMDTCTAILRGVEGSIAAHPANEGNPFASRTLILGSFSSAGMSHLLGDYVDGWVAADRAALAEARPRDRAHLLSETLQDWASLMSGLTEIGQPAMASRVFAALDAEMAPLTPESRARVYREILPHTSGAQREEILNRVRDLIGSDAERTDPLSMAARVQLNSILGEFSADPFEIQGAFTALTSMVRHERPSPEMLVEIHRYRLALRNHIHDIVRAHPDRLIEGSDIREIWLWADGYQGRDGGSNAIVDELTAARRSLLDRLSGVSNAGERRRILTLLNDSFREGMRMRLHGNDYGLQAFIDQHLEMIRALRPTERPSIFAESLQFLNQMEVERARHFGHEVTSFRNVYYDTMTAALPSLIADIPAGPERRSAILQFTRALSQAREVEERRLRAAERALVTVRATTAYHWAVEHGFGERFIGRDEAEAVDGLRPAVDALRRMETSLWNQFAEGESIPEARHVYEGFARAMSLTVEGRSGEARAAMLSYYSDPEVQAFLRSDAAGDAHRAEAQDQIQQLLDVSATILNGEAGARFDRTLRIVRGLARIRLHTLRAEGEEYPYDIGTIDRMTMELPRFLATLPPDRMPQTFEEALRLFGAANEGNSRLVSEYNGAINRIPVQRVGSDGAERTGSVWGLIRAMEHIGDPGGAARAFAALQQVVADDTDWDLLSMEGRGDLGPALQDFCDIILDEGTNISADLRQSVANFRARIPEEEEWGHFLRQTFNWQLAVDIGLMALSGGMGGLARAAVSRIVIGLAERAALRMVSTGAIRFTMMAGRGIAYVGGHVASGVTFNLIHASTSALILNRPMDNPFASGLRMSGDSMINDPISMMLFSAIPGPSSMVGRFIYRQVATAITFQISQNIRYHAERGVRDLWDSDFHRALERRERMRAMYESTGDTYYQDQFEAAERRVTAIIGHEPDNSVRGIMLNIGMNIGQAGADHVMGTHHWAGNMGLEAPHAAAERPEAPRSEAERAERRDHHLSLADALANTRATRYGSGREAAGPYRGSADEGPAREAAARRVGEERAFFRELVDLEAYDHYASETLDHLVDQVARHFDPSGVPPALNEASRRFLRFFLTHVNPENANRVGPEGLTTLIEAALSRPRGPASRTVRTDEATAPVEVRETRSPGLERGAPDLEGGRRPLREDSVEERIRDREADPEAELSLRLMGDEATAETMAHLDDLLRGADPEALRTDEGRQTFLNRYREARELLEANPEALGGLRPHEALSALLARGSGEDLPTAARRLVAGEIRLRSRHSLEYRELPAGLHADSPARRLVAEELTARYQETTLREAARAVEHARREIRTLTALLQTRANDPRFAPIEAQTRDIRVRLEAAHRRVAEVRESIRTLRGTERELSRRNLPAERRRELTAEANRLRRNIAERIEGIRRAEAGVTRFAATVRALDHTASRPPTETAAREGVRVEIAESDGEAVSPRGGETETRRRVEAEGPEIEIVDEGVRVDLSEATGVCEEIPTDGAEDLPPHLVDPSLSANSAAARMSSGVMAALGLGSVGLATLVPGTAHAQDATSAAHATHGVLADSSLFLSSLLEMSPLAMTGTLATAALGFGAVYALVRRAAARARAAERRPDAIRESGTARGRAAESSRGEADGGGQGRQQGDAPREEVQATEIPARSTAADELAVAAPEIPSTTRAEPSFEGVLQDNAPGAPRRGAIERREATPDYGTASAATHEGVGYKDANEDALVQGTDATGAHYAVVLDGMGGMGRGDQASRLAGEVIQREMSEHGDLLRAFRAAHDAVRQRYRGAGACAVAHRVFRGGDGRMRMEIIHAGDAGAVVFGRDGRVIYRSRDQSHVQMLADAGAIEGGELGMRTHPDVNVVMGGLGPTPRRGSTEGYPPVRHEIVLEGGERAVMFSDGLGDNASTEEMVRRTAESASATEAQQNLLGLALQRMGILDTLYPQFENLPEGTRIPFTAPDGRTLYLARDVVTSGIQGVTEMINVYDAAAGGNLVDHYKPDNVAVHVYFHDPVAPAAVSRVSARAAEPAIPQAEIPTLVPSEAYVPTVVPAEGAPQPVDLPPPPPPRLNRAAELAQDPTVALLNTIRAPELSAPPRPGEAHQLHFPDLAGFVPVGREAITGPNPITDPSVAPRHAVIERIGPNEFVVQNIEGHQTYIVAPDGSYIPVPKYGMILSNGQEIVMGATRVRVTASGRAPTPETGPGHYGYHAFRHLQSFAPNFDLGAQVGFGVRIHPETRRLGLARRGFAVESAPESGAISVHADPRDPNSAWRTLAPGERRGLRFENGVSEEFQNAEGLVFRMTESGTVFHVRGGPWISEVDAPMSDPIEMPLGERDRFVIGTRPESDVALPPYSHPLPDGRQPLDPYLHVPSSNDPNLRFAPDVPADHAEVYRTPEGEWRVRNLSGAVMEIVGAGEHHFFVPRGAELTLTDGQVLIFRGERPYRYRFRVPRAEAGVATPLEIPAGLGTARFGAWAATHLEASDAAALNRSLEAEGAPFRVVAQEGSVVPEAVVSGLARTPPQLALRFENGRLTPESTSRLLAYAALPEGLRARLHAAAQVLDSLANDLVLRENPLALNYIRAAIDRFHQNALGDGLSELGRALENLSPETVGETEAALARLAFWSPENLARNPDLLLGGISGYDGFYLLHDAHPQEFPDPVERAAVQARVERQREDSNRTAAEAALIRPRIQEHFRDRAVPEVPALNDANLRAMVSEMLRRLQPEETIETLEADALVEVPPPAAPRRAAPPPPPPTRTEARGEASVPQATPTPSAAADAPILEARRRGREAFRALGTVLSAFSVRRSPELTAALQNIRETLRGGDARELQARLERARNIFSDPQLRELWSYAESLARGERVGTGARDLLLAILDGRVLDADQARTFLRSTQPALRMERRMQEVARDLSEALRAAGLGTLAENPSLAEQTLRPLLRRLFADPRNPPSEAAVNRELLELSGTLTGLRRELERQSDLSPQLRRQLLEGYLIELAAGRMDRAEALRLVAEGNAAMVAARRTPTTAPDEVMEVDASELLPVEETIRLDEADILPEAPPPSEEIATPRAAPTELFAQAELPAAVVDFINQRYEAGPERESRADTARHSLPLVADALREASIDPETPLGRWIANRILFDVASRRIDSGDGRVLRPSELSRENLSNRIAVEWQIFELVQSTGFHPASREGLRLAAFLYRRQTGHALSGPGEAVSLRVKMDPNLLRSVDRLVLLAGDRSAQARERWLEWALEGERSPEILQEVFWETLAGVRELRIRDGAPESVERRERPTEFTDYGERITQTLDDLGIPAHSPAGLDIATLWMARAAVEATPGNPSFSRLQLNEHLAAARTLVEPLREILRGTPGVSAADRAALTHWALRSRATEETLGGLLRILRRSTDARSPSPQDILQWVLAANPSLETMRRLRDGDYRLRRGPGALRLVTREGRAVATELAAHLQGLREDFADNFLETTSRRSAQPESPAVVDMFPVAAEPAGETPGFTPTILDPLTVLSHPERRDAFEDSLIALEDAGLIPPGTSLEDYRLPGRIRRADGPGPAAALFLRPGPDEASRFPYRVESVEDGTVRLRRLGDEFESTVPADVELVAAHARIPFLIGDYVYFRFEAPGDRPSRGPGDRPSGPGGPELPTRGMTDAEIDSRVREGGFRFATHPGVIEGAVSDFSIPRARIPDINHTDTRAEMELRLIDAGPGVWLSTTLPALEAVAADFETHSGSNISEYGPIAARIRAEIAVVNDPNAPLDALDVATRRLADILRLRQEFPAGNPILENFFRDRVLDLYRNDGPHRPEGGGRPPAAPGTGAASSGGEPAGTVRPPRAGGAEARRRAAAPSAETRHRTWGTEAELLGEIDTMASREVEEFSDLARRSREELRRHDETQPADGDPAAMRAWREEHGRILDRYRNERTRIARELVARHEGPGRRVLEFLQGIDQEDALWSELGELGFDRPRLAPDLPPHGRAKAVEDVLPKIERRRWNSLRAFTDLFGTRVVVESYEDAISVVAALRRRFSIRPEYDREGRPLTARDGGARPDQERIFNVVAGRRSGYRALHVVVEADGLPVEIQIQTRALYRWGAIQHEFYKNEVLARAENADLREATDRYFEAAARSLAENEQGALPIRPRPPEFASDRLARLPEASRDAIRDSIAAMETLLTDSIGLEHPREPARAETEVETLPIAAAAAEVGATPRPGTESDSGAGGNNLHASFLGAGLMMAMTSMGHAPDTALLAGILGTVLPIGIAGVFRWVRGRLGNRPSAPLTATTAPQVDYSVRAEDGAEYVFRPFSPDGPALPGRYFASVDRALPSRTPDYFEVTFVVLRQQPGEAPSQVTIEIPVAEARRMGILNELGHTQRGARLFLDRLAVPAGSEATPPPSRTEMVPLEAAPPPEPAPTPLPSERPLLQANGIGGNLAEIDGHLAGHTLSAAQLSETLTRYSRRATLPGGELVYLATQGIDPKHPVGEDFMGGLEYRDPQDRRVYSMMVADGMGGMGHGDAAAALSIEAFTAELSRSGDIRRAWDLANAAVREFNRAIAEAQDRDVAMRSARERIADPSRVVPGSGAGGAGACSVSFSIIPPARADGPYVLQSHFAGDASLRVYRRGPDGSYRRVYATVEENVGTLAVDTLQEHGRDVHRTREIRLNPAANQVTNGVGANEALQLSDTARGEIPRPGGRVARATGYEHGLVLQEGDLVLAGSDGFWENFIDTGSIAQLIRGARSAEDAHRILREETHARMEIVRLARARLLPVAGNGRFRFTHRGRDLFIDRKHNVFESETASTPLDKYKPDNFSLAAYLHQPRAAEAAVLGPVPRASEAPAAAARPVTPRPRSIPPPIPEAARRRPASAELREAASPPTTDLPGDLVIGRGDHLYRIVRGGPRLSDGRFVYQLRLDSEGGPSAPIFQEILSTRPLDSTAIEAVLRGGRPLGTELRQGWSITDLRSEGPQRVDVGAIPLEMIPTEPGMRSVQVDFYVLPNENAFTEEASIHPRILLVDPSARGATSSEPAFVMVGAPGLGDAARRGWILQVQQNRTPVYANGNALRPFTDFFNLQPESRIRVGSIEFIYRDQSLIPDTTALVRLSVPPPASAPESLPIAAAPRRSDPGSEDNDR